MIAGTTFSYLHHRTLAEALDDIAALDLERFELVPMVPHINIVAFGPFERHALRGRMRALGLACSSINPGYVDLNISSTNDEFREVSLRQLEVCAQLAHDISAPRLVVIGGRQHALQPAPHDGVVEVLEEGLKRLVDFSEPLGVKIALENSPYGFPAQARELTAFTSKLSDLEICYDVANALIQEDAATGLRHVAGRLGLVHVSDSTREQWQHTNVGRGEVDFPAFASALKEINWRGDTVYEVVNGKDPGPRLRDDLDQLAQMGLGARS